MSQKKKKAIICGIRMYDNKLILIDDKGIPISKMENPCKPGEMPSDDILGLLISTYINDIRIGEAKSFGKYLARRLNKMFLIVKK